MTELEGIFQELGISHYLHVFIEQGFDTWDTILDITESDFDALGVKLGHRRKIQRKIAESRGLSSDRALASPRNTPSDERHVEETKSGGTKGDVKEIGGGGVVGQKRKYRRHPKPDENAPERPPSAYVIFSNKMREEMKGMNLTFTEIAKLVGENWQNLAPTEKEPYEQQAFSMKERFNAELTEYKKTDSYREYSLYLAEFKARQANQQSVADLDAAKRPKLEPRVSTASNGTSSSGASQHGSETGSSSRHGIESSASANSQWSLSDGHLSPHSTVGSRLPNRVAAGGGHTSPIATSPTVLPGYRESMFGGNSHQPLPWRGDAQRDEAHTQHYPRVVNAAIRRPGHSPAEPLNSTGSFQHAHRSGQLNHPPPLLSSESTNRSSNSSASTASFFNPRTPLEPPLDRVMPLPALYPQKAFDTQLPPLRPPSLSPQTTMLGSQQSPTGISPNVEFPTTMAPLRGFTGTSTQSGFRPESRQGDFISKDPADENLDPVSALLRAGEIVSRNTQRRS